MPLNGFNKRTWFGSGVGITLLQEFGLLNFNFSEMRKQTALNSFLADSKYSKDRVAPPFPRRKGRQLLSDWILASTISMCHIKGEDNYALLIFCVAPHRTILIAILGTTPDDMFARMDVRMCKCTMLSEPWLDAPAPLIKIPVGQFCACSFSCTLFPQHLTDYLPISRQLHMEWGWDHTYFFLPIWVVSLKWFPHFKRFPRLALDFLPILRKNPSKMCSDDRLSEEKLLGENATVDDSDIPSHRSKCYCNNHIYLWGFQLAFFLISLSILSLFSYWNSTQRCDCEDHVPMYSPALEAVRNTGHIHRFDGSFATPNKFKGTPSPKIDAAWANITYKDGIYAS